MSTAAHGAAGSQGRAWRESSATPDQTITEPLQTSKPTLESVHREHFAFICRTLRGLGVLPEAIDDAAQETLFVVHRRLGEYEPRTPLRSWLFRIASHVASNHRRSMRRRRDREAEGVGLSCRRPGPETEVQGQEALRLTERFLDGLDEGKRAVFVLALIEELPAPEVAAALGIPVNTVYSRIRVLRQSFRAMLAQYYQEASR